MSKEKQLLKNTTIVSIGKIATQLITFLLLPVYTAVLTKEEYGIVDLLNTLVSLVFPIITLQIEQGIFRYLVDYRDDRDKQKEVITSVFRFVFKQLIIYIVIFLIASIWINNSYKYFLAGNIIATMFTSILLQICRGLGDNKRYALGSFLVGACTVILNVIFIVAFKWGAYGMLGATILANIIAIIYLSFSKKIYSYIDIKKYNKCLLKEIVKYSIPLVPNIISWWIVDASDRSIISWILGIGQNGVYSAANKFSNVFMTLYSVFNITWTESAAININTPEKDEFFSKIFDFTIRFFGALALVIIATVPFVFQFLINEQFAEAYNQIPILMIAGIFNVLVSFIGSIYVAKKITREIAKTSIFAAIINIVVNILLIKHIGLYAASISTVIAYMSMFIYRYIDCKKYVALKINSKLIISIVIMIICSISIYFSNYLILKIINVVIIYMYAIIINRNSVKFIMNSLKKYKNRKED